MTPKWGFRVAMRPVGALCFYQAHFGRTVLPKWPLWVYLFYSVFYSVSELRIACFRQAHVAGAVLPPGALFRTRAFALPPLCPQFPHVPASTFWGFRELLGRYGISCSDRRRSAWLLRSRFAEWRVNNRIDMPSLVAPFLPSLLILLFSCSPLFHSLKLRINEPACSRGQTTSYRQMVKQHMWPTCKLLVRRTTRSLLSTCLVNETSARCFSDRSF